MLSPRTHAAYSSAGMLSADGRCKALDASADGYGRAEAVGALALVAEEVGEGGGESENHDDDKNGDNEYNTDKNT